jgi:hypothetical protein
MTRATTLMSCYHSLVLLTLALTRQALAHTWIEQLTNVASNGTFIAGFGYARNFVDRETPGFNGKANEWLVPQAREFVNGEDLLCHPSQRTARQTPGYPRLQSTPGTVIALRYLENGHATISGSGGMGKPEKGGTVFVFGTNNPAPEEKLLNVLKWTRDGSGGDKRGMLLTAQNFDDGRCYQLGNNAPLAASRQEQNPNPSTGQAGVTYELPCETDVLLPDNLDVNTPYTLYWVWQWPTAPSNPSHGKDEYYTSCIDVDIVSKILSKQSEYPLDQQDQQSRAVNDFLSRQALTQDPLALTLKPGFGTLPFASTTSLTIASVTQGLQSANTLVTFTRR